MLFVERVVICLCAPDDLVPLVQRHVVGPSRNLGDVAQDRAGEFGNGVARDRPVDYHVIRGDRACDAHVSGRRKVRGGESRLRRCAEPHVVVRVDVEVAVVVYR